MSKSSYVKVTDQPMTMAINIMQDHNFHFWFVCNLCLPRKYEHYKQQHLALQLLAAQKLQVHL